MHPFVVFGIILVIIWTLSAAASAAARKQERERRERLRQQMLRAGVSSMNAPRPAPVAPRQRPRISPGIAKRFPDVLLPPKPAPQRQSQPQRRPQPVKAATRIVQQQRQARVPKPAPRRQVAAAPPLAPPPLAQQAAPTVTQVAPVTAARAIQPARQSSSRSSSSSGGRAKADARALARWLRPATLQQQFIVTEIFQPPLALRDPA